MHKAEEIPYFEGKIDFLLSFAGITRDNVETMSHDPDVLDAFDKYLELTKMAFERQDTNLPDTSLLIDVRRALLTKGDYSMREGNLSYLVDSRNHARTLGWRNMLRLPQGNASYSIGYAMTFLTASGTSSWDAKTSSTLSPRSPTSTYGTRNAPTSMPSLSSRKRDCGPMNTSGLFGNSVSWTASATYPQAKRPS